MRRRNRILAVLGVALGASAPALAGVPGIDPRVDDRIMVGLQGATTLEGFITAFETLHPSVDLAPLDAVPGRPIHLLQLTAPPGSPPAFFDALELSLEAFVLDGTLHAGEFLYENQAPEGKSGSTWVDNVAPSAFDQQYAKSLLGVGPANARSTGANVVVAIVDTGLDTAHPVFQNALAPGGWNFIDGNANVADVGNGADDDGDGDTDEMTGHGTFVAGLVRLVAPEAKLLPVRALDSDGVGDSWLLIRGVYHAIDQGVEVINLSLGTTYDSVFLVDAVAEAQLTGIVVTSAAGNLDRAEPREFPAMDDLEVIDPETGLPVEIPGALGTAATDHADVKADFSNFSDRLFISAPGNSVAGPIDPSRMVIGPRPGGGWAAWEGTSFSCAFVAGAAALVRSQHPEWSAELATSQAINGILLETVQNIDAQNPAYTGGVLGAGRLRVDGAVLIGPPAPGTGDLDGDGSVGISDLLRLLSDWGLVHSSADLDGDGSVGFPDLLVLLGHWS